MLNVEILSGLGPVRLQERIVGGGRHLVDNPQAVERSGISDKRQKVGQHIDQPRAVVANVEVCSDVALDLRFASAERDEHAEGEKFTRWHVDAGARVMVTEAVSRQVTLDVQLISGR